MPSPIGNFFIKAIVNSPLHGLLGDSFAVITLTGRKSGRRFSTPINVKADEGGWTVVSSRERTWWRNLRQGRTALLRVGGKQAAVQGEIVEAPADVRAGLADYFRRYPAYAKYFAVPLGADGQPESAALEHAARERVIIRLRPA